jgi:hypothetical protein
MYQQILASQAAQQHDELELKKEELELKKQCVMKTMKRTLEPSRREDPEFKLYLDNFDDFLKILHIPLSRKSQLEERGFSSVDQFVGVDWAWLKEELDKCQVPPGLMGSIERDLTREWWKKPQPL